jgi:cytochrome c553
MRNVPVKSVVAAFALVGLSSLALAVPVKERELDWVLKRTPDPTKGAQLYETCAACHGDTGQGATDGSVPAIGGQHFMVLAKQLVDFRAGSRMHEQMRHFSDSTHLAYSQYVADVAAYISRLPAPEPQANDSPESNEDAAKLYAHDCARCHGEMAEGRGDELAPRLAAQHSRYTIQQLQNATTGQRSGMEHTHAAIVKKLTAKDIAAVAAFLSSLPASSAEGSQ